MGCFHCSYVCKLVAARLGVEYIDHRFARCMGPQVHQPMSRSNLVFAEYVRAVRVVAFAILPAVLPTLPLTVLPTILLLTVVLTALLIALIAFCGVPLLHRNPYNAKYITIIKAHRILHDLQMYDH